MAALDGAFYRFFDLIKDGDSLAVGQIGKVIATAVVIFDGKSRELPISDKGELSIHRSVRLKWI